MRVRYCNCIMVLAPREPACDARVCETARRKAIAARCMHGVQGEFVHATAGIRVDFPFSAVPGRRKTLCAHREDVFAPTRKRCSACAYIFTVEKQFLIYFFSAIRRFGFFFFIITPFSSSIKLERVRIAEICNSENKMNYTLLCR